MMCMLRRLLLVALVGSVLLWFFRTAAYRSLVRYEIVGQRAPVPVLASYTSQAAELDEAIQVVLDSTAARLRFSTGKVSSDPQVLRRGGPANCIGYAALCAALLKGQLEKAGLSDRYEVAAVVGKLYVGDQDLHAFITTPFWKDHDVVRVRDHGSNEVWLLDPALYDVTGIGLVCVPDQ
jgi:hypothetical protein